MGLIFFIFVAVKAQQYIPFPTDSAQWSVEDYIYGWFPEPDQCFAKHYGLFGDTVIDSKNYSKLYQNYTYTDSAFNIQLATYVVAIREDSLKKVWIRKPIDTLDILYYDFALNVGDTFCFDYFGTICSSVEYVDSILINGNYRRRINFIDPFSETWIEGIGSTTGWFERQYIGNLSWQLLCFFEKQNQLYGDSYCHCDTYTGIENRYSKKDEINIFPNPTFSKIYFNKKLNEEVIVLNTLSEIVLRIKKNNISEIDISQLPNGLYYLKLLNKVYKIVKTN